MKIHIEFCEKWNYHSDFDRVSKQINNIMPSAQVAGNSKPPRSGAFEVTIDGKLIYSKFQMGIFPNTEEIKSWF